jgi:hypothetical protein
MQDKVELIQVFLMDGQLEIVLFSSYSKIFHSPSKKSLKIRKVDIKRTFSAKSWYVLLVSIAKPVENMVILVHTLMRLIDFLTFLRKM